MTGEPRRRRPVLVADRGAEAASPCARGANPPVRHRTCILPRRDVNPPGTMGEPSRFRRGAGQGRVKTPAAPPAETLRRRGTAGWDRQRWHTGGSSRQWPTSRASPPGISQQAQAREGGVRRRRRSSDGRSASPQQALGGQDRAATKPPRGGRDEACRPGPTPPGDPRTNTPAHALPGGQAEPDAPLPCLDARLCRPDLRWRARARRRAKGGKCRRRRGAERRRERQGVTAWLQALAHDLRAGRDRPPPVRRSISPSGRTGTPLGCRPCATGGATACRACASRAVTAHFPDPSAGFARSGAPPQWSRWPSTTHLARVCRRGR